MISNFGQFIKNESQEKIVLLNLPLRLRQLKENLWAIDNMWNKRINQNKNISDANVKKSEWHVTKPTELTKKVCDSNSSWRLAVFIVIVYLLHFCPVFHAGLSWSTAVRFQAVQDQFCAPTISTIKRMNSLQTDLSIFRWVIKLYLKTTWQKIVFQQSL